jgi:hypothetical protein
MSGERGECLPRDMGRGRYTYGQVANRSRIEIGDRGMLLLIACPVPE